MVLPRLALQRRRLFVTTLLAYLSGLQYFSASDAATTPAQAFTFSGALAIAALSVAGLVVLVRPQWRKLCETGTGGALIAATLAQKVPVVSDPLALFAAFLAGSALAHGLLYGRHWAALRLRFDWTTRRRFVAPCPAAAAWARLVPDPANPAAHYTGVFIGQRPVPDQPGHVIQTTRAPDGGLIETTLILQELSPPHRISYRYFNPASRADYSAGHYSLTLRPGGKTCTVLVAETVHALSVATALDLWFDDFGGEMAASMLAALSNRPDPGLWMRTLRHSGPEPG